MSDKAMTDPAAIARALPKGAARACMAMTGEYQFPGKATFSANGAWSLHWARGVGGRGALCEDTSLPEGKHKRAAYRLTPFGLAVREYLRSGK